MPVITISRQFGAAGAPVGRDLSERLGAEYLDRVLVAQAAARVGIPEEELRSYDERLPSIWQRVANALAAGAGPDVAMPVMTEDMLGMSTHDRLRAVTRQLIEEAAARGNAVIVGRGGAFILRGQPGVLNVQLHAAMDKRVSYLLAHAEEVPSDARPTPAGLEELARSIDSARSEYIRRVFDADWLDIANYDLSSTLAGSVRSGVWS